MAPEKIMLDEIEIDKTFVVNILGVKKCRVMAPNFQNFIRFINKDNINRFLIVFNKTFQTLFNLKCAVNRST